MVTKTQKSSNGKGRKIIGWAFVTLSICLFYSLISYCFHWKEDQDVLETPALKLLFDSSYKIENGLGKIGAIVSHLFIHQSFGISAFFIPAILLMFGLKLLLRFKMNRLGRFLKFSGFALLWAPPFFDLFQHKAIFNLGGTHGHATIAVLTDIIGLFGTIGLLALCLIVFIINFYNPSFEVFEGLVHAFNQKFKSLTKRNPRPIADPKEPNDPTTETQDTELEADHPFEVDIPNPESTEDSPELLPLDINTNYSIESDRSENQTTDLKTEEIADGSFDLEVEKAIEKETHLSDKEIQQELLGNDDYDPTLDLSSYRFPSIELLDAHDTESVEINRAELERNKNNIVSTLNNYNISISKISATVGPTVTLYEIIPAPGVRISKIKNLEDDIALSLSALGIRIIAPIPGKGTIGIEVPNENPEIVGMKNVLSSEKFQKSKMELPIALGKTISNETFVADLAKMPHLLMAGATGQGKSVGLNAILVSLLYKKHPSQIKFVLVDPKKVELTLYNKIEKHFLAKLPDSEDAIITDTQKVIHTLNSLCLEMDQRYELLKTALVRNIAEYNAKFISRKLNPKNGHRYLPYIVLVIDEFADLIMTAGKEVELPIARLAQLARAIGIHLIIATQRPSVNIITGTIKANFPSRIAFRVTTKIDSRTILDASGADQLIGRGDMLFTMGSEPIRLQCAFLDTPEVKRITDFIEQQQSYPSAFLLPEYQAEESDSDHIDLGDRDELFEEAAKIIVLHQQGSASLLQRKLKLGYNRAGRIVDQLELCGIIGPPDGSKARKVLIPDDLALEQLLTALKEN